MGERGDRAAGGGLPQPAGRARRRRAPGARARPRAGRARRAAARRGVRARGAGDPARDRPPRRRADPRPHAARPAQARDEDAARDRARRRSATRPEAGGAHRLPRARRTSRRPCSSGSPRSDAPARARRLAARPAARPRARAAAAAGGRGGAGAGPRARAARAAARPESLERIAAAEPDVLVVCAYGVLVREPLLERVRDLQRPPVAAAALARRGAGRAVDHGRRRGDGRLDHAAHRRARLGAGVPAGARADRAGRRLRHARRAARGGERRAARPRAGRAAGVGGAGRGRRHVRPQDRGGRPDARPHAPAGGGRAHRPGAAAAHRRAAAAARREHARGACRARRRGRRSRPPAGTSARTASGCCWTAAAGRWSCSRSSRRARRRCPPRPGSAAGPTRALTDFWLDPRLPGRPVEDLVERAVREWDSGDEWAPSLAALVWRGDDEVLEALAPLAAAPDRARPVRRRLRRPGSSARSSAAGPRRARRCWRRWASARAIPRCSP